MIYGVGHDIVDIDRMRRIITNKYGERFLQRILTPEELELIHGSARVVEFASGRFAAKEAISKAFGCGIGQKLGFGDISVMPDERGKPQVKISTVAWDRLGLNQGSLRYVIHLSISHERNIASAYSIVERLG